jgi:hypothetical protein
MRNRLLLWWVGASLALGASSAWADKSIDVGRITAVFKEAGWTGSADMPYNIDILSAMGTVRGKGKVLSLAAPDGAPLAVMYVGATYPQGNVYNRRGNCGSDARFYIRDLNDSKLEDYRCLYAGGPYATADLMKNWVRYLNQAAATVKVAAPEQALFVRMRVTSHGGYLIEVEALLSPSFVGLTDATAAAEVPALLQAGLAPWADKLGEAAVKALTSFSGDLIVPRVEFSSAAR